MLKPYMDYLKVTWAEGIRGVSKNFFLAHIKSDQAYLCLEGEYLLGHMGLFVAW